MALFKIRTDTFLKEDDGTERFIGIRTFKRHLTKDLGFVFIQRRYWRARLEQNKIIALQCTKPFFGFWYIKDKRSKHNGRTDGQLYWFSSLKDRNAWLMGEDLPDHLDSFAEPVDPQLGECRRIVQAHALPGGWRQEDALHWTPEKYK